jgi:plasmid stability protein
MAGLVQIRNVPDETRRVLKARAAARGVSLNDLLLDLLVEEASRPTVAEVLARARARREMSPVSSVDIIRADRDSRS